MNLRADPKHPQVRKVTSVEDIENLNAGAHKYRVQVPVLVYREITIEATSLAAAMEKAEKYFDKRWSRRSDIQRMKDRPLRVLRLVVADALKAFRALSSRSIFAGAWQSHDTKQAKQPGQAEAILVEDPIEVPREYYTKQQWGTENDKAA